MFSNACKVLRPMKVLMVSKALVVGAYHKKLEEMAKLGIDLHLIIPHRWGKLYPEKIQGEGYTVHRLPAYLTGHNHFHFYRGVDRLVGIIQPDVVHIDEEAHSAVTFQIMHHTNKRSTPALFFNWQNIFKKYPFPFSYFERFNFNHAAAGITGNEEARDVLRKKGCTIPLYVIPQFGVDLRDFSKRDSTDLKLRLFGAPDVIVIGYAGRLVKEKGILTLVDAFARLPAQTKLLLLGSGPLKRNIQKRTISAGVADRVVICDHIPSTDMALYLNCMYCLVLPSITRSNWKEQFGRVLIEAMACGVPVIGSNSGEIPNVVGGAGLIFQEGNAKDLSDKLQMMIHNKKMHQDLSKKGFERVREHFTQSEIAKKTYAVYESFMSQPK
jgi:glycosyltransferase involved in cell wall biosynthesis